MSIVRRYVPDDLMACTRIVRESPEYFTPDVAEKVAMDAAAHDAWVIECDGQVVAFAIVERRSQAAVEILWMAVEPGRRSQGHGTALIADVIESLVQSGVRLVEVKTLDQSAGYAPYEATRSFWEARGFIQIDTIDPLPGWPPGNPAALYVAALAATR